MTDSTPSRRQITPAEIARRGPLGQAPAATEHQLGVRRPSTDEEFLDHMVVSGPSAPQRIKQDPSDPRTVEERILGTPRQAAARDKRFQGSDPIQRLQVSVQHDAAPDLVGARIHARGRTVADVRADLKRGYDQARAQLDALDALERGADA